MLSLRKKWQLLDEVLKRFQQESLLEEAWKSILKMVEFDSRMFTEARSILREEYNEETIKTLRIRDLEVNSLQKSVREDVLTHLALSNKYKNEISFALGMVTIVNGLERIGDNCKNIADLAMISRKTVDFGKLDEIITPLENTVFQHFDMLKDAFTKEDGNICKEIMVEFRENVSIPVEKTLSKILQGDFSDLPQTNTVTAALYLRYLKRIDANQKNVASIMVNPFTNLGYKIKDSNG